MDKNEEAQQKVRKSLTLIAQAQDMLGQACRELCSINGACGQWELVGDHYDATKNLWHKVNSTINLDKIEIDDL